MPNENRSQYNTVVANRTRVLTNQSPLPVNKNGSFGYEHISHSTPENNTYDGNGHASHHIYQGLQNNRHNYHAASFQSLHTNCDQ